MVFAHDAQCFCHCEKIDFFILKCVNYMTQQHHMNFTNVNLIDFIDHIIKHECVDNILNECETQSEKGFVYERLWDLCIKFGFCESFLNSEHVHKIGNPNTGKLKNLKNLDSYLENEKVFSGNSSGCSDITLQNINDGTYIFISSKFPKSTDDVQKQKSVEYYDVQNIVAMAAQNKNIYTNYKIYLTVPKKKSVLEKVKKASDSSGYITDHMKENNIFDKNDLDKCFTFLKNDILKNKKLYEKISYTDLYLSHRESLNLRFHQELITQKTSNLIEEGSKSFLWGCKCRSGKTFMAGGIIIKEFNKKNKLNVLIITPAPTETMPQFTEDLFSKFRDFDEFKINNVENSKSLESILLKLGENNIFVMSKQLLQKFVGEKTINEIKKLKLDLIIFDENHYSGTTDMSKIILDSYSSKNTAKIYLTATYNKPLKEWNIPTECQLFWNIEDEQICKSILNNESNINKLKEKHGDEHIDKILKYYTDKEFTIEEIFTSYKSMPDLHLITNMFDSQRYDTIKENIMNSCYGFSFDVLFSLREDKKEFKHKNEVITILRYISGSFKEQDFKNGDKSIFSRINNICSRTPFTQIWFLPSDNINEISNCLTKIMQNDNILKKYDILSINRKNKSLAKDVKDEITKCEIIAKETGKMGLILLAGNMLSLGITLNNCDVVMLMNNALSSDKIMQQMYRCMTEGVGKKMGFVVDLNMSRVLHTCVNHSTQKNDNSAEDKIKYIIENNLINIDADMLISKKLNSDVIVKKLLDIWKGDPINSFKSLLRNLDNDYVDFDSVTQKMINNSFINTMKDKKIDATVEFLNSDDELQELPSGKQKTKENSDHKSDEDELKKEEKKISFTKDVLPYVIPLTCILTIKNKNKDFAKMLNDIKNDKKLLEVFDEQCLVWWNKKNLIKIVEDIVSNFFDKSSNTYNISIQFKMSLQSLIDSPKELLELVNECLKPKTVEKKTFGEVFTPMKFINDSMLKDLENHWFVHNKENIWTNEKLTYYDPATGMGNYPIAIFYKLMDGLKSKIIDEKERKKHIIEKMIFMGELNRKNCFIVRQIFNLNNEFKLNLYEGDTLDVDIKKVFMLKKSKFDVIIGNPPYNEELTQVGAKPLYNKFIEYYVDKCNILSFVVPSRWFAGGKGLDKFRNMMLNRSDIVYINHENDASKIFGNSIDITGGVNYFLINKKYEGLCNYNGSKIQLNKYDILVESKYCGIIDKLKDNESITKYYVSQDNYKIQTNDSRLVDDNKEKYLKCYVSQQKGFVKYINKEEIKKDHSSFKMITARANGSSGCFGNMFIGKPNEVHTKSYISFNLKTEKEAESLLSYLKCKLPNFMLSLRKISQDISESTCKWIPLPPLDKQWNDDDVYKYFKLSEREIKIVKDEKIFGYKEMDKIDETENTENTKKPKKTKKVSKKE